MERAFPKDFLEKFGIPSEVILFVVFTAMTGKSLFNLLFWLWISCSNENSVASPRVESKIEQILKCMEHTHPVSFCLLNICSIPFDKKFTPVFLREWKCSLICLMPATFPALSTPVTGFPRLSLFPRACHASVSKTSMRGPLYAVCDRKHVVRSWKHYFYLKKLPIQALGSYFSPSMKSNLALCIGVMTSRQTWDILTEQFPR